MSMEHWRKNLKFSGRNLFHYHFVDHQFYIDRPGIKTGTPQWETVIICVSRGHLQFETLLDLTKVIWYTPSTLEMPARKACRSLFLYLISTKIGLQWQISVPTSNSWKFVQCFLSCYMMMDRQVVANLFCMFSLQMGPKIWCLVRGVICCNI